jgi:tetratricopeptide (TPR) repeat protein
MGLLDRISGRKKEKVEETQSKHFQTYLHQGKIELESRDFEKAVSYFDKAIEEAQKTQGNPLEKVYVYKARALDGQKKYAESEILYDKAFELKPDDAFIWLMRGHSYAEQGMKDKALKYYDKAFELDSRMEEAMLAKAAIHEKQGQYDKQVESYQRILQKNPESIKAKAQLQKITEELKKQTNRRWLDGITKKMENREAAETKE